MDVNSSHADRHSEEDFSKQFLMLVDSGAGVIHVRATELLRAVSAIRRTVLADSGEYREWDIVNGSRDFKLTNQFDEGLKGDNNPDISSSFSEPLEAMRVAMAGGENTKFYVYLNPHVFMDNNPHMHQLLLMYNEYLPSCRICVVLVTPDEPLPESAAGDSILSLHFATPGLKELRTRLSGVLADAKEDFADGSDVTDDGIDRICYAGAGMTALQFDTFASLAAVKAARERKRSLDTDDLVHEVSLGKTEIVNSSDILELYPSTSIGDVGGMENLKDWITQRSRCYSDEARDFGVEAPKGMVLVGPPGCLHGDTVVDYRRGIRNSGRSITLAEMYKKFNGISTSSKGWDTSMPTYLHSLSPDGDVFYNRVISVIEAGVKPVLLVTTDKGDLRLTANHPVAQPGGSFVQAGNLRVGDTVLMRGSMKPMADGGRRLDARPPRRIDNVKYHPNGSYHEDSEYYWYKRVAHARLVVEAHMNHLPLDEYLHALRHNSVLSQTFTFLPPEMEVHHVDEDTLNDELSNLMVLHKVEHAREHGKVENFNVEYVTSAKVLSVVADGQHMTYDVQMDMPANNFVADGFIVHNTGKSLVAKAIAGELGVPLVRMDFGRVFSSYIGSSEQRIRTALRMVEAMSPCVLFCDEIDKGLGGISGGGGGDSGVSLRVLGSFLTWLQDCQFPVFTMVTANNVDSLPPELLRRGRFDAIFSTSLPNDEERRAVLAIHLAKRGRDIEDFYEDDIVEVIDASDKYVPAEIESAVKDGLVDAFSRDEELTMGHIVKALGVMVPLSKAFAVQIERMTTWANDNATPVSISKAERAKRTVVSRKRATTRRRSV